MSMNIHLSAELQGDFTLNTGNKIKQNIRENFDCIQTRTEETKDILKANDKYEAYKEYVIDRFKDSNYDFFIYSDEDPFCEEEPVDVVITNDGDLHIERLDDFLKEHEGWNIIWHTF